MTRFLRLAAGGSLLLTLTFALPAVAQPGEASDLDFKIGQALFERLWVPSPATTKAADGLGPLFTARACSVCHKGGAGGQPPDGENPATQRDGLVLRFNEDPVYGRQFQPQGVTGLAGEGKLTTSLATETMSLPGGATVALPRPVYGITDMNYGPLAVGTRLSARLAPRLHGTGLLERVPEEAILALADPDDRDSDGVSGRAHMVETADGPRIGRFGWKAIHPTVTDQNAEAFLLDIGLSTPNFPQHWGDCTEAQTLCRTAPHGDTDRMEGLEVPSTVLGLVDLYVRGLPAERASLSAPADGEGLAVFTATGCAACHRPTLPVTPSAGIRAQLPDGGTIAPFTDLLLHDMGDGLADEVNAGDASGREWRTAPLWHMRKRMAEADGPYLLHDGRARDVGTAILWHGGEALAARDRFVALTEPERQLLIRFVEGL